MLFFWVILSFREVIELEDVIVFDNLRFASHEERVRYYILRRRVLKVYPYAKLAADRLTEMNRVLDSLPKKSQKAKIHQTYSKLYRR